MILHVVFDDMPDRVSIDDVYFTTNQMTSDRLCDVGCKNVIFKDITFIDESGEFSRASQGLFKQLPEALVNIENDVFSRMMQPILFLLSEIEKLVHAYEVTELFLYRGNKNKFLAAEKSEGESGKTWLYKRAWMFNPFIYDYFKEKVNVCWKEREKSIYISSILFIRSFILYYGSAFGLLRDLFRKSEINIIEVGQNEEMVLCTVWVKQQYMHLRSHLDSLKKYRVIFIGTPHINDENYNRVEGLTYSDIKKVYKQTRKVMNKIEDATFVFRGKQFLISRILLKKALRRTFLVYYANYLRYCNTTLAMSKRYRIRAIVNNKTWNWTQSIDHNVSQLISANHITLQSVMLPNVIYPNKDIFGKVFLSSKQQYELFKKAGIETGLYSGYPILYGVKEYNKGELIISVFLQSDMYEEVSIQLIDHFAKHKFSNANIRIIIKPHYRQNKNTIEWIKNRIAGNSIFYLSGQQEEANEIIKASHISVSFTSAVLFEAACFGTTPVSIIMNDFIEKAVSSSEKLSGSAILKYTSINSLLNDFSNPVFLITKFRQERKHYFECLFGEEIGIEEIIK